jgi:hypothetical protein
MSKPILQTEVWRSMTKVTTTACRVPTKQMRVVSDSGASYLLSVAACSSFDDQIKPNII